MSKYLLTLTFMIALTGCISVQKEYYDGILSQECQVWWPTLIKNGWCKWYKKGQLGMIAHFKNNVLEGEQISYYGSGIIRYRIINKNDRMWDILEYNDNQGNRVDFGDFKNGNGLLRIYQNKTVVAEGQMVNGLKEGNWKFLGGMGEMEDYRFENGKNIDFPELDFKL